MPLIDIACGQIIRSNGIILYYTWDIIEYGLEKEIDCGFTYDTGKNPQDRIRNLEFIVLLKQKIKMDFDYVQSTESLPRVPHPDLPSNIALSVKRDRAWRFVVVCVCACKCECMRAAACVLILVVVKVVVAVVEKLSKKNKRSDVHFALNWFANCI